MYTHLHDKEGPQYTSLTYAGKKLPNTLDKVLMWGINPQLPLRASLGGLSGGMNKPWEEAQIECWEAFRNLKWHKSSEEKLIGDMEHIEMSYQLYPEATEKALRGVEWWPSFKEGHRLRWNWHDDEHDGEHDGHHDGRDDPPRIVHVEYDDYEQTFFIAKPYYDEFKQLVENARSCNRSPDYAGFVNKKKRYERRKERSDNQGEKKRGPPPPPQGGGSNQTAAPAPEWYDTLQAMFKMMKKGRSESLSIHTQEWILRIVGSEFRLRKRPGLSLSFCTV